METWQDELRAQYPWARNASFSVGPGWRELVTETFARLDVVASARPEEEADSGLTFAVCDLKEKYGSLRIECVPYDEETEAIVDDAENRSEKICDVCGENGSLRGKSWLMTRCDAHDTTKSSK